MRIRPTRAACMLAATLFALVVAAPVEAAANATLEKLLIEKGLITQEELEEVRKAAAEQKTPETSETEPGEEGPQFEVSVGSKGLIAESTDGQFLFGLGGRIQVDAGGFSGGVTPQGSGIEIRRARIKSFGTLWTDWAFKLEVNFDNSGNVSLTDGWLRYNGFEYADFTVGHQKVPFSQQSMTSSNWQVFQERSLQDAFIDTSEEGRRRLGGVIGSHGDHWNASVGAFGAGVGGPSGGSDEDWGVAGRFLYAPLVDDHRLLKFGGAIYYRDFESTSSLRYAAPPEAHLASFDLVDTGATAAGVSLLSNAAGTLMYNLEASFGWDAFHAQAEYTGASVMRRGMSSLYFQGWYVQAGYFITGESRNFDIASGKFKRITTESKWGALEVALRYSMIDLQDKTILGGREDDITAGLNWWVNPSVMFRFNYVRAMTDPTTAQIVPAMGGGSDQSINAYTGRLQVVF